MAPIIRPATPADAEALLGIYAYYVRSTAISFEYEVPSLQEFRRRITETLERRYPYLCVLQSGKIVGYACAGHHLSGLERPKAGAGPEAL